MNTDTQRLNNWVDSYTSDMLAWTSYRISDAEVAKDIVQETFFSVVKNINNFKEESNPKTWIFSILNNKIADYYRKKYREAKSVDYDNVSSYFTSSGEWKKDKMPTDWAMGDEDQHLLDNLEFIEILNYCIKNLPGKFESVINMKYYTEKSTPQICQELGISTTNMWQIMHRAKLKLRECIDKNWFNN